MYRLDPDKRARVVAALVEGNSIRATARITKVDRNTITSLLVDLGAACAEYQDKALRDLPCRRIQCDEIWAFCYAKDKNVPAEKKDQLGFGSIWTWTAIDADSKLIVSWMVGNRDANSAHEFIGDLSERLKDRIQLTTDGHRPYLEAVDHAFGGEIDYAMLVKIYGDSGESEKRYSPAEWVASERKTISGNPARKHINTSYVERQNLTMRMPMRRFTRLTTGFSKKLENHIAAVSLRFMHYNFVRIHQTLRVTPAMASGVTDRLWEIGDIIHLLEEREERLLVEEREERLLRSYTGVTSSRSVAWGSGRDGHA